MQPFQPYFMPHYSQLPLITCVCLMHCPLLYTLPVLFVCGSLLPLFSALQFLTHLLSLNLNVLFFFNLSCSSPNPQLHHSQNWSTSFITLLNSKIIGFMLTFPLDEGLDGRLFLTWKLHQQSGLSSRENFICRLLTLMSKWYLFKIPKEMVDHFIQL